MNHQIATRTASMAIVISKAFAPSFAHSQYDTTDDSLKPGIAVGARDLPTARGPELTRYPRPPQWSQLGVSGFLPSLPSLPLAQYWRSILSARCRPKSSPRLPPPNWRPCWLSPWIRFCFGPVGRSPRATILSASSGKERCNALPHIPRALAEPVSQGCQSRKWDRHYSIASAARTELPRFY